MMHHAAGQERFQVRCRLPEPYSDAEIRQSYDTGLRSCILQGQVDSTGVLYKVQLTL